LERVFQAVFRDHVVKRFEQVGVNERLHLRGRVNDSDVRHFFGSRLRFKLQFLLVGVQGIQLYRDVRMIGVVLISQLSDHLYFGSDGSG
jgi:hypothetical protein